MMLHDVRLSLARMEAVLGGPFSDVLLVGHSLGQLFPLPQSSINSNSEGGEGEAANSNKFALVLFDRMVDLLTPFTTPFSFQALLDNVLQINYNTVKIDETLIKLQIPVF